MKKYILTTLCAIGFNLLMPTANASDAAVQKSFDAVVKDYQKNPKKFAASELTYYRCEDKSAQYFERIAKTFNRAIAYYYDFRYLLDGESLYAPSQALIQKVGGADSFFERLSMEQLQMMSNAVLNALSVEDKQSVKLLLETLQKRQMLFQNFITPENDKLLKLVEKTSHYINVDTLYELGLPKTNACYSSSYHFNNVSLIMSEDTYFSLDALDFQLDSFWLRRHRAGTTEKAKQLLDYALSQLSDIPSLGVVSQKSHLSAEEPQSAVSPSALADNVIEKTFSQLKWVNANANDNDGSRFGYDAKTFKPEMKVCTKAMSCYDKSEATTFIGTYHRKGITAKVYYSEGASTDPNFTIDINGKTWNAFTENLAIKANGVMYTEGNINHSFNERRKYHLTANGVKEVKQPFLYVGVKDKLLKPTKLYADKSRRSTVIANLPKGYEVEVLVEQDGFYLTRTKFGLVGWLILGEEDNYAFGKPLIRGLGFLGD